MGRIEGGIGGLESGRREGGVGWGSQKAVQSELSINDRFTERFLFLFGDCQETQRAASTLIALAQEISQHEAVFELLLLSQPVSHLSRRCTRLRFGGLEYPVVVQVGRWGEKGAGELDVSVRFAGGEIDRVRVDEKSDRNKRVLFTGSHSSTELDILEDGSISVWEERQIR